MPTGVSLSKRIRPSFSSLQGADPPIQNKQLASAATKKIGPIRGATASTAPAAMYSSRANILAALLQTMSTTVGMAEHFVDAPLVPTSRADDQPKPLAPQARQSTMDEGASTPAIENIVEKPTSTASPTVPVATSVDVGMRQTSTTGAWSHVTVNGTVSITSATLNGGNAVTFEINIHDKADTIVENANAAFASASNGAAGFKAEVNFLGRVTISADPNSKFRVKSTGSGGVSLLETSFLDRYN